jgi:hypothetical protein
MSVKLGIASFELLLLVLSFEFLIKFINSKSSSLLDEDSFDLCAEADEENNDVDDDCDKSKSGLMKLLSACDGRSLS